MIGKGNLKLWIIFAFYVFIMIFIITFILSVGTLFLIKHGLISFTHGFLSPIVTLSLVSILTGGAISIFVARIIIQPIHKLNDAMETVANGNFEIRIQDHSKIREIRKMAENFNLMAHELSGIETLRNDFIVNVSHEFKTPISSIEGYASLLQDPSLTDNERAEYSKMIRESARQLSSLSGNILNISKLENQEIIIEKTLYRLDEQLRQALLILEPEWSRKNIDLDVDFPTTLYFGNEELMLQVWFNLFGNAIKFTGEQGMIRARLTCLNSEAVVEIADTGIGMSEEVQKHIFEKFYQAKKDRYTEGNGLGLTFVKRILDLVGGTIETSSREGLGTTLIVKLPLMV